MKRTISIILCLLLIAALCAGCSFPSGKGGKDASAPDGGTDSAPAADEKEPAPEDAGAEDPGASQKPDEPAEPADTEWPDTSDETSLPEIEIPFEEDVGDELVDPAELTGDADADDYGDPGFSVDEDLITDNDDITIDEDGATVLPEVP